MFDSIVNGISSAFDSIRDFIVGSGDPTAPAAAAAAKPSEPMGEGTKWVLAASSVTAGALAATVVEKTAEYAAGATAKGLRPRGGVLMFGR